MKRTARRPSRWSIVIGLLAAAFGLGRVLPAAPEINKGETKRNNLVTELLNSTAVAEPNAEFTFSRATEGWVFIAATFQGTGACTITLDPASQPHTVIVH